MLKAKLFSMVLIITTGFMYAQRIIDPQLVKPIQQAIIHNYDLQNKSLEIDKNKFLMDEINGKLKPNINAIGVGGYLYTNGSIDLPTKTIDILNLNLFEGSKNFNAHTGFASVGITATQVIFSGLQIPNAKKALEEKNFANENLMEAEKQNIIKDVLITFDQLMLLDKVDELISNSAKRLEKEHLKVQKAIQNGLAIPYDREKIKLAMLELEAKKVEIKGTQKLLYDKLQVQTHLNKNELEQIKYDLDAINLLVDEFSIANKRELKALQHATKAYQFLYEKEKGAHLPQVFAFAGANATTLFGGQFKLKDIAYLGDVNLGLNNLAFYPIVTAGIGAKWDIYDGGQHKQKLNQAKADIQINENKLKDAEEKLNLLLNKNKIEYETASEKLKVNQQQNTIATNNLDIASKRFQEGLIDVTERLAAENDFYKANLGYYSQIIDQRKISYEVLHTAGELYYQILN